MPAPTHAPTDQPVVSRFAPSPTGELHIGGARTALYAWALAKASGHPDSRFLLRFEDTDLARSSDASAQRILDDLNWLGIVPDNYDPAVGIDSIPRQSRRHEAGRYTEIIQQLIDAGHAYRDGDCDDDPVRFKFGYAIDYTDAVYGDITSPAESNEDFIIQKGVAGGKMPTFHLAVVVDDHDMGVTHVLRGQEHLTNTAKHAALLDALGWDRPTWAHTPSIMNPGGSKMSKRDIVKASRTAHKKLADSPELARHGHDFCLFLADELSKKYHATTVNVDESFVDESGNRREIDLVATWGDQKVAFEIKARRWYATKAIDRLATKQLASFLKEPVESLLKQEFDDSRFGRLILYAASEAIPEVEVSDFQRSGYLPAALLNYVALLGWNPGNDLEQFDLPYLAKNFSLSRVNKGNSTFDRAKLASFNQDAILAMTLEEWAKKLRKHFEQHHPEFTEKLDDPGSFAIFAAAYQERSKALSDPATQGRFFVEAPATSGGYNAKAVKKNLTKNDGEGLNNLAKLKETLAAVDPWDPPTLRTTLEAAWEQLGCKNMGGVAQPLRVALTGTAVSPEIDATLALLGQAETLNRIDACLTHHQSASA